MTDPSASPEFKKFLAYVEQHPARLRCWDRDPDSLFPLLAWLNTWPITEQRRMAAAGENTRAILATRSHHNQLGMAVNWAYRFVGRGHETGRSTEPRRRAFFELAGTRVVLDNLLADVRFRTRQVSVSGESVTLRYAADARLDSLDRILEFVNDLQTMPSPEEATSLWSASFRSWRTDGWNTKWPELPLEVQAEYRRVAGRLLESYPRYLSGDLDLGGFTVADAEAILLELLARAMHSHLATVRGSLDLLVALPWFTRQELVAELAAATGRSPRQVALVVDLLTYRPERNDDPCLAPVMPVGEALVPMCSLIVPSSLHRNFTALLQKDPGSFGAAGQQIGALGIAEMKTTLSRLTESEIATGIKVRRPDGSSAGDLDVVAYDPGRKLMAVFEVMWRIGPDGAWEIGQTEALAAKKRRQVIALRSEIQSGAATAQWPSKWRVTPDVSFRWFVITPTVLPLEPVMEGVTIRSHRMLAYMLKRGSTVPGLIRLMDRPPYPPRELAQAHWRRIRYGKYTVDFDQLPP